MKHKILATAFFQWNVRLVFFFLVMVVSTNFSLAQRNDQGANQDDAQADTVKNETVKEPKFQYEALKEPSKAALMSAALPGLGQYYNRKLWFIKVPIIYAGFGVLGFIMMDNHNNYIDARNNLVYTVIGEDDRLSPLFQGRGLSEDNFRRLRDRFRRDRDYNIILMLLWYGANLAEAAVTAHLKDFNVDEDLSVKIEPSRHSFYGNPVHGVSLVIRF